MYTCAICGKEYANIPDRVACETKCLEKLKTEVEAENRKLEKKNAEENINKELTILLDQYHKVSDLIKNYYEEYHGDIYDSVKERYIPRSIFDYIF